MELHKLHDFVDFILRVIHEIDVSEFLGSIWTTLLLDSLLHFGICGIILIVQIL